MPRILAVAIFITTLLASVQRGRILMSNRIYACACQRFFLNSLRNLLLASLLCLASIAKAENLASPNQFIHSLLETSRTACLNSMSISGKAHIDEAYSATRFTFCQCYPERARQLKNSLPKSIQETPISEKEFVRLYLPEIVNKCAKEQAISMFSGDCPTRLSKSKPNSSKYCSCMANYIDGVSDMEAAQIGLESSKYIPLLAESNKRGQPPPKMPAAFKNFMAMDSICTLNSSDK